MIAHLRRAAPRPPAERSDLRAAVAALLDEVARGGEAAALDLARRLDGREGGRS